MTTRDEMYERHTEMPLTFAPGPTKEDLEGMRKLGMTEEEIMAKVISNERPFPRPVSNPYDWQHDDDDEVDLPPGNHTTLPKSDWRAMPELVYSRQPPHTLGEECAFSFPVTLADGSTVYIHSHTCGQCGKRWGHPSLRVKDQHALEASLGRPLHDCPSCGAKQTEKDGMGLSSGARLTAKRMACKLAAKHKDSKMAGGDFVDLHLRQCWIAGAGFLMGAAAAWTVVLAVWGLYYFAAWMGGTT